jgi:hypothetical protein
MTKKDKLFQHIMYRYENEGSFFATSEELNSVAGFKTQDRSDRNVKASSGLTTTMSKFRHSYVYQINSYFDKFLNGYVITSVTGIYSFNKKYHTIPTIISINGTKYITIAELARVLHKESVEIYTIFAQLPLVYDNDFSSIKLATEYGLKDTLVFTLSGVLIVLAYFNFDRTVELAKIIKKEFDRSVKE